jgi:hypothetical protein
VLPTPPPLLLPHHTQTSELTEEQKEYLAKLEAGKEAAAAQDVGTKGPSALFHGKEAKDYQVRAWGPSGCCCEARRKGGRASAWREHVGEHVVDGVQKGGEGGEAVRSFAQECCLLHSHTSLCGTRCRWICAQ